MPDIATLNAANLPVQFRYLPYVSPKRISSTPTAKGVVTQRNDPLQVDGANTMSFTAESISAAEYQTLLTAYNAGGLVQFVGYWGETLLVRFQQFAPTQVYARLFDVSGEFLVVCVLVPYNATC